MLKLRHLTIIIVMFLFGTGLNAQNLNVENIINKQKTTYKNAKNNEERLSALISISHNYHSNREKDSFIKYFEITNKLSNETNNLNGIAYIKYELEDSLAPESNPSKRYIYLKELTEFCEKNNITEYRFKVKFEFAKFLFQLGNNKKSLDLFFQILENSNDSNMLKISHKIYEYIAFVSEDQKDYKKSIQYYKLSIEAAKKFLNGPRKIESISETEMNLATLMSKINLQGYDKLFKSSIKGCLYMENYDYAGAGYGNLSKYYFLKERDLVKSKMYEDSAVFFHNKQREFGISSYYYFIMMELYFAKNNQKLGFKYADSVKNISIPQEDLSTLKDFYIVMAKEYAKAKNYKEAFQANEELGKINEKVSFNKISNQLIEQEARLDYDKKEAINKTKLEEQKIIIISGSFVVIILIGLLFLIISSRRKIKKERQISDGLLLNILPEKVAQELKKTGKMEPILFQNVSVMFTDFKDFTIVSQKLTPKELVNEIDYCFCKFDEIIAKFNIEKIKTIGDAYVCASGLPAENPNHAKDIVLAALEIRDFIFKNYWEKHEKGIPTFQIRIGVHSGEVVAGVVGSKKFAFDIWGDAVNTAARMEQNSIPMKVNISESTCSIIKNDFQIEERGKIIAKNKGELSMFFVEKN